MNNEQEEFVEEDIPEEELVEDGFAEEIIESEYIEEDEPEEELVENEDIEEEEVEEEKEIADVDMTTEQLQERDEESYKKGEPSLRLGYYECSKCGEVLQSLRRNEEGILELDGEASFQKAVKHIKDAHNIDS